MKTILLSLLALGLFIPASATVSIEFQLGGIDAPAGSIGVLVADTANDGFATPLNSPGTLLTAGSKIGNDDTIVSVFPLSSLSEWGAKKGFAHHITTINYTALGLEEGDPLTLYIFPQRSAGESLRTGEPHLSYRTGDLGQRTSNSTMDFTLPADGGAHLLGIIDAPLGGNADLAMVDLGAFPYDSGTGQVNREITPTARHTYFFELASPGFLSLEGLAGLGLVAELYGPDGQPVASGGGDTFAFYEGLTAGFHLLVLYREAGGSGNLTYTLDFANDDTRNVVPDLAVGPTLDSLIGQGVVNGTPGQIATLISRKAKPVSGVVTVANLGDRPDTLALRGGSGNVLCGIAYFDAAGNVTAGITSGTYRTVQMDETEAATTIRVLFSPNKKKLTKKIGRRTIIRKKIFPAVLHAGSTNGPVKSDTATIQTRTQ